VLQEREEVEAQWVQRFEELQAAAQERYSTLRTDLEAKVQSITERLTEMARRESKREKKRAELSRQVRPCAHAPFGEHFVCGLSKVHVHNA
jgi:DNA repair exonuclease SbcCD ATPase subunit